MFNIGFSEIILILVVGLVVFGPDKIPEIAKVVGKTYREFRRFTSDIRSEISLDESVRPKAWTPPPDGAKPLGAGEGENPPPRESLAADLGPPRSPEAGEEMEIDGDLGEFVNPGRGGEGPADAPGKNQSGRETD